MPVALFRAASVQVGHSGERTRDRSEPRSGQLLCYADFVGVRRPIAAATGDTDPYRGLRCPARAPCCRGLGSRGYILDPVRHLLRGQGKGNAFLLLWACQ